MKNTIMREIPEEEVAVDLDAALAQYESNASMGDEPLYDDDPEVGVYEDEQVYAHEGAVDTVPAVPRMVGRVIPEPPAVHAPTPEQLPVFGVRGFDGRPGTLETAMDAAAAAALRDFKAGCVTGVEPEHLMPLARETGISSNAIGIIERSARTIRRAVDRAHKPLGDSDRLAEVEKEMARTQKWLDKTLPVLKEHIQVLEKARSYLADLEYTRRERQGELVKVRLDLLQPVDAAYHGNTEAAVLVQEAWDKVCGSGVETDKAAGATSKVGQAFEAFITALQDI